MPMLIVMLYFLGPLRQSGMEGRGGGEKLRNEIGEIIDFNLSSILLIWNSGILKQDY